MKNKAKRTRKGSRRDHLHYVSARMCVWCHASKVVTFTRSRYHLQLVLTITKCFSGAYRGTFQEFYARIFCMLLAFDLTVPSELWDCRQSKFPIYRVLYRGFQSKSGCNAGYFTQSRDITSFQLNTVSTKRIWSLWQKRVLAKTWIPSKT